MNKEKMATIISLQEIKQNLLDDYYYCLDDEVERIRDLEWVLDTRCGDDIKPFSDLENAFDYFRNHYCLYTAMRKCEDIKADEPFILSSYDCLKPALKEDVIEWIDNIISWLE